jgi:hypothetical protein
MRLHLRELLRRARLAPEERTVAADERCLEALFEAQCDPRLLYAAEREGATLERRPVGSDPGGSDQGPDRRGPTP